MPKEEREHNKTCTDRHFVQHFARRARHSAKQRAATVHHNETKTFVRLYKAKQEGEEVSDEWQSVSLHLTHFQQFRQWRRVELVVAQIQTRVDRLECCHTTIMMNSHPSHNKYFSNTYVRNQYSLF